jgi:hypothetical protein
MAAHSRKRARKRSAGGVTSGRTGAPRQRKSPRVGPRQELARPRLTVVKHPGGTDHFPTLKIGEEHILFGQMSVDEVKRLRSLIRRRLHVWNDLFEVWVPTPRLLLRLTQAGAPDLSNVQGFRRLGDFQPLADPKLDDPSLWTKTTLGAPGGKSLVFGARREGDSVFWVVPVEGRAFFQVTPKELTLAEPELFGALGVDRLIDYLRGIPREGSATV